MKKLLILGTANTAVDMIKYAKAKGVYTIVTDDREPEISYAKKYSDEYWMINTSDTEALAQRCIDENVNGVICGISEFNIEMMIKLTDRLNLPCYTSAEAWHYSKDKDDFKTECKRLGVPVAKDFSLPENFTDADLDKIEYPVVVKPVDQNGNRGISYCYNKEELIAAVAVAKSYSKSDKLIIEKMLHGKEWYSYYALAGGEIRLVALNGMYAEPGQLKNLYSITSTVSDNVKRFVTDIDPKIKELLKKLGCKEGIAWVQEMLDDDNNFYIIEMGYRLPGDMTFVQYEDMFSFNSVAWLVDYALGEKHTPDMLPPEQTGAFRQCGCSYNVWVSDEGVLKEIGGLDEILKIDGVKYLSATTPGTKMRKHGHVGTFVFVAESCDAMCATVNEINSHLKVIDTNGNDLMIRYTDFDYLKSVYADGLSE